MAERNGRIGGMRVGGVAAATAASPELADPTPMEISKTVGAVRGYDYGRSTVPWYELDQLINGTHEKPEARQRIEREMARLLDAEVSLACKQEICRRLWVFGGDASLPSIEKMLADSDPHIAEAACYAIASRPSEAADQALRKALRRPEDGGLVAVATLLGDRRAAAAAGRLTGLAKQGNGEVASAAISALGKIASPKAREALSHLHAEGGDKGREASHALLESGRELLAKGQETAAKAVLGPLTAESEPAQVRRGAKLALAEAG